MSNESRYYIFLDESGDHGLAKLNPEFPLFLLCGVLIDADDYQGLRERLNVIKRTYWGNIDVIFHSSEIRKHQNAFKILFNRELKDSFYKDLNKCIQDTPLKLIYSAIKKQLYVERYPYSDNVYEKSLSFIIERAIFCLDKLPGINKRLSLIIEQRGWKEDNQLRAHFSTLLTKGTGYVDAGRLKKYNLTLNFRSKSANVNGLQLADLIAYPCARFILHPDKPNLAYEVCQSKVYRGGNNLYGMKIFPEK